MASSTQRSASVRIQFTGLDNLISTLDGISNEMRTVILASAVAEAAKPIVAAAKRFAPRDTGALQKSIKQKTLRYKNTGFAAALVGPSTEYFSGGKAVKKGGSRKGANRPCNYAHLVEFGHNSSKGFVAAHPFMRPAVVVAAEASNRAMTIGIQKGLLKALKKYKKGNL